MHCPNSTIEEMGYAIFRKWDKKSLSQGGSPVLQMEAVPGMMLPRG
jgi:hypothetical protein